MVVARWRQLRVWGEQKTSIDRDIALCGPAPVRALFALRGSDQSACPPQLLLRYDAANSTAPSPTCVRNAVAGAFSRRSGLLQDPNPLDELELDHRRRVDHGTRRRLRDLQMDADCFDQVGLISLNVQIQ
jgi:hypothetical protein